jgi:hypothetical protein
VFAPTQKILLGRSANLRFAVVLSLLVFCSIAASALKGGWGLALYVGVYMLFMGKPPVLLLVLFILRCLPPSL